MLASGADDSLVLVWDLIHAHNGAALNGDAPAPASINNPPSAAAVGAGAGAGAAGAAGAVGQKGPYASWRCEYEVGNLSWAPQSGLTAQGGEWVGVCGGRGVWGVKL